MKNIQIQSQSKTESRTFYKSVDKNGPLPDQSIKHYSGLSRCWMWTMSKCVGEYGNMSLGRGYQKTHRISFLIHAGDIPAGMCILHKCDNPTCVNPEHLFLGTRAQNVADMHAKGRANKASGDASASRLHPESRARGDRNGARLYPERLLRGKELSEIMKRVALRGPARSELMKRIASRGEFHHTSKLNPEKVRMARSLYSEGKSLASIGRTLGVTYKTIGRVIRGETWKEVE